MNFEGNGQLDRVKRLYLASLSPCGYSSCNQHERLGHKSYGTCSSCGLVKYCCKWCQVQDWSSHRIWCNNRTRTDGNNQNSGGGNNNSTDSDHESGRPSLRKRARFDNNDEESEIIG